MFFKLEQSRHWGMTLMLVQLWLSSWQLQLQVSAKQCREVTVVKWLNISEDYVKTLLRKPAVSIFEGTMDHCHELCRDYVNALYDVPKFARTPTGHAKLDLLIATGTEFVKAQESYFTHPDQCDFSPGTACLSFWAWTQNAGTPNQSCSCSAVIRALRIRKDVKDQDCSLQAVERRFEGLFKPFGFYLFRDASKDDIDCRAHESCSVPDTWQIDDLCGVEGGKPL